MLMHVYKVFWRSGMLFNFYFLYGWGKRGKQLPSLRTWLPNLWFPSTHCGGKWEGRSRRIRWLCPASFQKCCLLRKKGALGSLLSHGRNLFAWSSLGPWITRRILGHTVNISDLAAGSELPFPAWLPLVILNGKLTALDGKLEPEAGFLQKLAFISCLHNLGQVNHGPLLTFSRIFKLWFLALIIPAFPGW